MDPAGLGFVQKKPLKQARGLAGAIYRWLGIAGDKGLPPAAKLELTEEGKAKLLRYADKSEVIHVACPDFNGRRVTAEEAHGELTRAYANVLREFTRAEGRVLRLAPISGGAFAGALGGALPALTSQALTSGWMLLDEDDVEKLKGK